MIRVTSPQDLRRLLAEQSSKHYVYILRWPDCRECWGSVGTPFYVGIGQGLRLFEHERQAADETVKSAKVHVIRAIVAARRDVVREIEGFYECEPWDREEALINDIGRLADGKGPLTNDQDYARSVKIEGVELRKYAADHVTGNVSAVPTRFKLASTRLQVGPHAPRSVTSVFGKLFALLQRNPGVTGAEFLTLALNLDFRSNKSAYTQSGTVCASWVAGYIEGGFFRSDTGYFQAYEGEE